MVTIDYNQETAKTLFDQTTGNAGQTKARASSLVIVYSCGDFSGVTKAAHSDDTAVKPISITRDTCVPANRWMALLSSPFGDLNASRYEPLRIDHALITLLPSEEYGMWIALSLFVFVAFYAVGPGVCVWLALSELMPTRIRSNGMSIALVLNQAISTGIAAVFLPTVRKHGYSTMFFSFAAFTVIYFVTATYFLPETKGKTLEEIEAHFESLPRAGSAKVTK
jgi:hypothetical protein